MINNIYKNKQSAFTIVELLIVIVVIAILASITVAAYNGIQDRAKNVKRQSDIESVEKALSLFFIDKGAYPNCSGGVYVPGTAISGADFNSCLNQLVPNYLSTLPVDPVNSGANKYWYAYGFKKTSNNTFASDASNNYIIGAKFDNSSTPPYSGWGFSDLNYLEGSSN